MLCDKGTGVAHARGFLGRHGALQRCRVFAKIDDALAAQQNRVLVLDTFNPTGAQRIEGQLC